MNYSPAWRWLHTSILILPFIASSVVEMLPEMRERLVGRQPLTDAVPLDLAIRKGGRLVTLDQRAANLLPLDSPHRSAIEVIPV
jgi:hypothetical protein